MPIDLNIEVNKVLSHRLSMFPRLPDTVQHSSTVANGLPLDMSPMVLWGVVYSLLDTHNED